MRKRKNDRVIGTRDLLKISGIRNGTFAFMLSVVFGIVLMWLDVVGIFGVGVVMVFGVILFIVIARKDILEQRKLNMESGRRRA